MYTLSIYPSEFFQRCVKAKVHDFDAQNNLKIIAEVKNKLIMTHFSHLNSEFGM